MPQDPQRTCVVTRTTHDRDELVRLVASPDGDVVVDYHGKLPGRGAWILPDAAALALLPKRKGAIEKELGARVDAQALVAEIRGHVERAVLDGLSMAKAGGVLIVGRDRLIPAILGRSVLLVGLASDASARTVEDLQAAAGRSGQAADSAGEDDGLDELDDDTEDSEDEDSDDASEGDPAVVRGEASTRDPAAGPPCLLVRLPWTAAQIGDRLGRNAIAAFGAPSSRPAAWLRVQLRRLSALG